jgi:hypothetical protein
VKQGAYIFFLQQGRQYLEDQVDKITSSSRTSTDAAPEAIIGELQREISDLRDQGATYAERVYDQWLITENFVDQQRYQVLQIEDLTLQVKQLQSDNKTLSTVDLSRSPPKNNQAHLLSAAVAKGQEEICAERFGRRSRATVKGIGKPVGRPTQHKGSRGACSLQLEVSGSGSPAAPLNANL